MTGIIALDDDPDEQPLCDVCCEFAANRLCARLDDEGEVCGAQTCSTSCHKRHEGNAHREMPAHIRGYLGPDEKDRS